jgi:hypothetical protein
MVMVDLERANSRVATVEQRNVSFVHLVPCAPIRWIFITYTTRASTRYPHSFHILERLSILYNRYYAYSHSMTPANFVTCSPFC